MSTPTVADLMLRVLLALAPGIGLLAYAQGPRFIARLALAIALALAFEAVALRLRRRSLRIHLGDGSAVVAAVLLTLWLPTLAGWPQVLAVLVAIGIAKQAFGGLGANPYNPAMAGAAFASFVSAVPAAEAAGPDWLALAWLLPGLVLCALRVVRWQAPLGLLAGVALTTLASGGSGASIASAPWLLAAFFIASDPVTSCEQGRARLLFAAAIGVLAVLASPAGRPDALPFAVLAMNALAPALDAQLARRRTRASA